MAATYNYLKSVFQELQQQNNKNPLVVFIVLGLLSIPLSYAVSSISLAIFVLATIINSKKTRIKLTFVLLLPVVLFGIMALSLFWSIDVESSQKALVKELPLLLIPFCFMLIPSFSAEQKQGIFKYYSYGIVLFSFFYLIKASVRYFILNDSSVFFYHELVTKDVNAIHVSVYVAVAFFYFFTKQSKSIIEILAAVILFVLVFLLSSKNIIVVFLGLLLVYQFFYTKTSQKMRLKNLIVFLLLIVSLTFIGKIKERFKQEYETIMTDSSVNDVIVKGSEGVRNVSIKQAWNNKVFTANDYFPGTAFRVYQFRIFIEMLQEDPILFTGYGLNASYSKIAEKGVQYQLFLGDEQQEGYQTKNFHNQYIQNFAELGIFGVIILVLILALNMKNAIKNKDFVHISFAVLMISLFLTESFLWRQRGVLFFTFMYCLFNANFQQKGVLKKQE